MPIGVLSSYEMRNLRYEKTMFCGLWSGKHTLDR